MAVPGIYEISVNFVGDYLNPVPEADFTHGGKLIKLPHSPDRIVRAAEDKKLNLFSFYLLLKVLKVNRILPVAVNKLVDHKPAPVFDDRLGKVVIDRRQITLALFSKGADCAQIA